MKTKYTTLFSLMAGTIAFSAAGSVPVVPHQDVWLSLDDAAHFNVLVFENFSGVDSEVEGRLAVGGHLNVEQYEVADELEDDDDDEIDWTFPYSLVVGLDARFTSGEIEAGHTIVGGSAAGISHSVRMELEDGQMIWDHADMPINFADLESKMKGLSQYLATLPVNGTLSHHEEGLLLKGDCKSEVQVFHLEMSQLEGAEEIEGTCIPEFSHVVINVSGNEGEFHDVEIDDLDDVEEGNVLVNFYGAQRLTFGDVDFEASVLAPFADAKGTDSDGSIEGTFIAHSWDGNTEFEWEPFGPFKGLPISCEGPVYP